MWKKYWNKWKILAEKIANVQTRFILAVFYFIMVLPIGLIMRLFKDPLRLKVRADSQWLVKEQVDSKNVSYERRQY